MREDTKKYNIVGFFIKNVGGSLVSMGGYLASVFILHFGLNNFGESVIENNSYKR